MGSGPVACPLWSFDVATVPAGLDAGGRRSLEAARWTRIVVAAEGLVEAHLAAAQMAGTRGMVIEVLYRE